MRNFRCSSGIVVCLLTTVLVVVSGCTVTSANGGNFSISLQSGKSVSIYTKDGKTTTTITENGKTTTTVTENGKTSVLRSFSPANSSTRTVNATARAAAVSTVEVRADNGPISVGPSASRDLIQVAAVVTLGDGHLSKAAREQYLAGFTIPMRLDAGALQVHAIPPPNLPKAVGWTASYTVQVPASVALNLGTTTGTIAVRDTNTAGLVRATGNYGAITIVNAGTAIDATTRTGTVTIRGQQSVRNVNARSDYGSIVIDGTARSIDAQTDSGSVTISDAARAQSVVAESSYGSIELDDVGGAVQGKSSSGEVRYSGSPQSLSLNSDYGSVSADIHNGSSLTTAMLSTSSGLVNATLPRSASALISGHTSSGDISVNGIPAQISGDYEKSMSASLNGGKAPVHLSTDYGSVTLNVQ